MIKSISIIFVLIIFNIGMALFLPTLTGKFWWSILWMIIVGTFNAIIIIIGADFEIDDIIKSKPKQRGYDAKEHADCYY